jgi:thiamine biosynthesis lipoprotein
MGTLVSVAALVRSPNKADQAIGTAFVEMDRLVGIFSHYDDSSAASRLNQLGRLDGPPPELVRVVTDAQRYHRMTRGGFDVSVAPVVELFRQSRDGTLPDKADVQEALELVGAGYIDVSRRRIGFARQGMRMTLDGIAKGYVVDAIAEVLERFRIRDYLVEAGGDIRARGSRGHAQPWRVAVQDPDKTTDFPDAITLTRGAVATSGSYEEYYDPDHEHHHIVSAGTGTSPTYGRSVTVTAPTAMAADALATSVFLMEPRAGMQFVDRLRGCECLIIGTDGGQKRSKGWPSAVPL